MKIGINDGCAHGGMMDSLTISPMKEDKDWKPEWITEVSQEEWDNWQAFLKEHNKWEMFWYSKLTKENWNKGG